MINQIPPKTVVVWEKELCFMRSSKRKCERGNSTAKTAFNNCFICTLHQQQNPAANSFAILQSAQLLNNFFHHPLLEKSTTVFKITWN